MIGGKGVDFDQSLQVSLRLGLVTGGIVWVASSGLSSGLKHGGHQMLRSNSQRLLDPEHREKCEGGLLRARE
jgi:hypothetical protein